MYNGIPKEAVKMEENKSSLTARVSAFSRAYHAKKYEVKVFNDSIRYFILFNQRGFRKTD